MQIALILKHPTPSSAQDLERVVASVRKAPGVRRVDAEMARRRLLLVEIDSAAELLQLEAVEAIEEMGTKSVF